MSFKKIFCTISAIFVLGVGALLGWMYIMGDNKEFAKEGAQIVHVKVGMTTTDIAQMLHEKQLVKNPDAFKFEARFKGLATKLQAGMYKIEGGMSNGAIVNEFANGRIELMTSSYPKASMLLRLVASLKVWAWVRQISSLNLLRTTHLTITCVRITLTLFLNPKASFTLQPTRFLTAQVRKSTCIFSLDILTK